MKKVGILTFPNSPSYGASLQMFALYGVLKKAGYDVEVINYINSFMSSKKHIYSGKLSAVKRLLSGIINIRRSRQFYEFEKQIVLYPQKPIHTHEALLSISDRYTHVICGSDQVWNPYVTGWDMSYFFDFCGENVRKISYAPSFGIESIPQNKVLQFAEAINGFDSISVREQSGQRIVKELTQRDSQIVVDPSMLLTEDDWSAHLKEYRNTPRRYIAKFLFNNAPDAVSFCKRLGEQKGIPVLNIGKTGLSIGSGEHFTGPIGPAEWLYCMKNADHIVTDSFHGLAFSLIFKKDVYISLASKTNTRLKMLVETYDLANRVIGDAITESEQLIEYDKITSLMSKRRSESLEYLKNSLL